MFLQYLFYDNTAQLYLPQLSCNPLLSALFHLPVDKYDDKMLVSKFKLLKLKGTEYALVNQLLMC